MFFKPMPFIPAAGNVVDNPSAFRALPAADMSSALAANLKYLAKKGK